MGAHQSQRLGELVLERRRGLVQAMSHGGHHARGAAALPGTWVVALLLFGTRWASYLGYAPLFLTDLLVMAAILATLIGWKAPNARPRLAPPFPGMAVTLFLGFVLLRAPFPGDVFTLDWVRDLTPFLYAVLAFVGGASWSASDEASRRKTMSILVGALWCHLGWLIAIRIGLITEGSMPNVPGSSIAFFSIRLDADMAVLSITASVFLCRVMIRESKIAPALGLCLIGYLLTGSDFTSRAGLISLILSIGLTFVCTLPHVESPARQLGWLAILPLASIAGFFALFAAPAGQRLLATLRFSGVESSSSSSALGTEQARLQAWDRVFAWVQQDPVRTLVGGGFGNDFLVDSGAESALAGTDWVGVRSPHNWLVGDYARIGTIGVILAVCVIFTLLFRIIRLAPVLGSSELLLAAAVGGVSLTVSALMGVVLESPFGAVPFWWFYGLLMAASPGKHEEMAV